jgi:hypothetical protein
MTDKKQARKRSHEYSEIIFCPKTLLLRFRCYSNSNVKNSGNKKPRNCVEDNVEEPNRKKSRKTVRNVAVREIQKLDFLE